MTRTMSLWLLFSSLLLSSLIHEAKGIRVINDGDLLHKEHDIHEKSDIGVEEVKLSKDKDSSGRIRKLGMIPISSTATISKNAKNEKNKSPYKSASSSHNKIVGRKEENLSIDPSYITGQPQAVPELTPDIVDVAGMDYSLASRKPPVHN